MDTNDVNRLRLDATQWVISMQKVEPGYYCYRDINGISHGGLLRGVKFFSIKVQFLDVNLILICWYN